MKNLLLLITARLMAGLVSCNAPKKGSDEEAEGPVAYSGRSMRLDSASKGFQHPESVTSDGTFFYISNLGKVMDPFTKDGDGFIMKLDTGGNVVADRFIDKLDAPKGLLILGGKLYVSDVDKVKAFDLKTGAAAGEFDLTGRGTHFLNDLVKKSDTELFVSATDINKIYDLNIAEMSAEEVVVSPTPQGPNGLWYDALRKKLYVVGYVDKAQGQIGVIDLEKGGYEMISDFMGSLDGVAIVEEQLITSDWNRRALVVLDMKTKQIGSFSNPKGVKGPADFYFDKKTGEFWLPAMEESAVYIQSL